MPLRFGKHPAKRDYRTLRLKNYFTTALPPIPAMEDVVSRVVSKLGATAVADLFPMDGNDRYGDCTCAALAHAITAWQGLVGRRTIMPEAEVTKLYLRLTGGIDSGLNELDVLNYWRQNTVMGDAIMAYASVNPKDHAHVRAAIHLFGGAYLGFQCQENLERDFEAGRPWQPGRLTNDGHAVYATGYDADTVTVLTWGAVQKGTWAWWDETVDECYAIIPPEAAQPGFCQGVDFAALQADLQCVAH